MNQAQKERHGRNKRTRFVGTCNLHTEEGIHRSLKLSTGRIALPLLCSKSPIK